MIQLFLTAMDHSSGDYFHSDFGRKLVMCQSKQLADTQPFKHLIQQSLNRHLQNPPEIMHGQQDAREFINILSYNMENEDKPGPLEEIRHK